MNLRFITATACSLALAGTLALGSCSGDKEDENASIVNVEKGVAPVMATPDAAAATTPLQTAGIIGATRPAEEAVEEAQLQAEDVATTDGENKTSEGETKPADKNNTAAEE